MFLVMSLLGYYQLFSELIGQWLLCSDLIEFQLDCVEVGIEFGIGQSQVWLESI